MSAPLLILLLSAVFTGGLVMMTNYRSAIQAAAVIGAFVMAVGIMVIPVDQVVTTAGLPLKFSGSMLVFGRSLVLNQYNRALISFLYAAAGIFFLSVTGRSVRRRYFPAGVLMTVCTASALMVDPLLYAALFLELAALFGVLMLAYHGKRNSGSVFLVCISLLAMIAMLLAGWTLDTAGVTAGAVDLASNTRLFLGFGAAVLLGLPPFTIWILKAAKESDPNEWSFAAVILQTAALFVTLIFLRQYGFLRDDRVIIEFLKVGGTLVLLAGAVSAVIQEKPERFLIFAITADMGVMMMSLGAMNTAGFSLVLVSAAARVVGVAMASNGLNMLLDAIQHRNSRTTPSAMAALTFGFLTVSGFPLTGSFPVRWSMIQKYLLDGSILEAAAVSLCTLLIGLTAFRWVIKFSKELKVDSCQLLTPGNWGGMILVGTGVLLGLMPQLILLWMSDILAGIFNIAG